ncbi:MAG: DDE-type integrase/transposase/recombinase [Candidatus Riflebacteria bacterium]
MKTQNNLSADLWRLSIIGELIHRRSDDDRTLTESINELAGRKWSRPDGSACELSSETIRKWLYRFRAGGLVALKDRSSGSRGPEIGEKLELEFLKLRQEKPRWTIQLILKTLLEKQIWNGRQPSQQTIYRWCKLKGLLRTGNESCKDVRAFEFRNFGELWVSDFMHGPRVQHEGRKRKTYLLAIIDDASRYVVVANFHLAESVETLMINMRTAIQRFGIPMRFYTDNGSSYRSQILRQLGQRFNIAMPHTPPYTPQGRGKIERFFRTVREQLMARIDEKTLPGLNRKLHEWLALYHNAPHSGIEMESPFTKRSVIENSCRELPPAANIDSMFMQQRNCRVYKDGTVRLQGKIFETPEAIKGGRTEIHYYPWDLSQVFYSERRLPAKPIDKLLNARRFEKPGR